MAGRLKIIQAATNDAYGPGAEVVEYAKLLREKIEPIHRKFAEGIGYEYEVNTSTPPSVIHPFWMKARMMLDAIHQGFDKIVWLDTDVVWMGEALDPQFDKVFGATYHESFWHPNYFNAGVLYVNCNSQAESVVKAWFDQRVHNFNDQEVLNANLREHISPIGWEWNCHIWIPHYTVPNPKVVAWHGCPDRIRKIRAFIEKHFPGF